MRCVDAYIQIVAAPSSKATRSGSLEPEAGAGRDRGGASSGRRFLQRGVSHVGLFAGHHRDGSAFRVDVRLAAEVDGGLVASGATPRRRRSSDAGAGSRGRLPRAAIRRSSSRRTMWPHRQVRNRLSGNWRIIGTGRYEPGHPMGVRTLTESDGSRLVGDVRSKQEWSSDGNSICSGLEWPRRPETSVFVLLAGGA